MTCNIIDRICAASELVSQPIRNLQSKFLLKCHEKLYSLQGVQLQVLSEPCLRSYLRRVDFGECPDQCEYSLCHIFPVQPECLFPASTLPRIPPVEGAQL